MFVRRFLQRVLGLSFSAVLLGSTAFVEAQAQTPELGPGDLVQVGGLGVIAPARGEMVELYVDYVDGSHGYLAVRTLTDGTVLVNPPLVNLTSSEVILPATGECVDNYTDSVPVKWLQRLVVS